MSKPTRLLPLLVLLTALLAPPPTATAGTYTVHSCKAPSGTWVGADGWTGSSSTPHQGRDSGIADACTTAAKPLGLRFGGVQLPVDVQSEVKLSFQAPSDTSIAFVRVARAYMLEWPVEDGLYGRGFVYDAWYDDDEAGNQLEFRIPPLNGRAVSSPADPLLEREGTRWEAVSFRIRCWELLGSDLCGPSRSELRLESARIGIDDSLAPWVSSLQVASIGSAALRGMVGVSFGAQDAGGGVYRSTLTVDGVVADRAVVDANGGKCRDVEEGNDDAYEFASPQPCPLAVSRELQYDTRALSDGQHTLRLTVEDAAGNSSTASEQVVTTHNAPALLTAPALAGAAGVGLRLTADSGLWDGVPTAYDHRWLRCDADGNGCTAIAGASGQHYTPVAGDAYHRVIAEVVAANANGAATARSAPSALVADAAGRTSPPEPAAGGDDDADRGDRGGGDTPVGGNGATPPAAGSQSPAGVGGIANLQNPLGDQAGRAPNGTGASAKARIEISLRLPGGNGGARTVRSPRNRRWTVAGRLVDGQGRPIAGARLNALRRVSGRRWVARGLVRTRADGGFTQTLPPGPSRAVRFTYFPFGDSDAFRASNTATIDVFSPLTIRADRRVVTGRRIVTLSGRAGGELIPAGGLLVTLQGFQRGWGWRTFKTVRTSRSGGWRTSYRFRATSGRFSFRAIVPRQGSYPFITTTSAAVAVTVR